MLPALAGLGYLMLGDDVAAEPMLLRAVETTTEERMRGLALAALGAIAYRRGDWQGAGQCFRQALAGITGLRDWRGGARTVEYLAFTACASQDWERCARLLGAAEMLFDLSNMAPLPRFGLDPDVIRATCREKL